jgi:hypothetical protein
LWWLLVAVEHYISFKQITFDKFLCTLHRWLLYYLSVNSYLLIDVLNIKKNWTKLFLIQGVNQWSFFFLFRNNPYKFGRYQRWNQWWVKNELVFKNSFMIFNIVPLFNNPLNASLYFMLFLILFFFCIILSILYRYKIIFKV